MTGNDTITCICNACEKPFALSADRDEVPGVETFIRLCGCESGGIYAVKIKCPHCGHVHSLE